MAWVTRVAAKYFHLQRELGALLGHAVLAGFQANGFLSSIGLESAAPRGRIGRQRWRDSVLGHERISMGLCGLSIRTHALDRGERLTEIFRSSFTFD